LEASSTEHVLERNEAPAPLLVHIKPQMLPSAWQYIEPILQKACDESGGEMSIDRILANIEHWPILAIVAGDRIQAVMVTYLSASENGERKLHCMMAAGDSAHEWPNVDDQFDEFARSLGCTKVRIDCARKGWLKTLPHWKWVGVVLEREI
jgi:hypothetical protein